MLPLTLAGVLVLGLIAGPVPGPARAADDPPWLVGAHGLRLPATFQGVLPCADCPGIRHHLDLWPDQQFQLRREWLDRGEAVDLVGRWRIEPESRALVLPQEGEAPLRFEIEGLQRLRLLDSAGRPIDSTLPYELQVEDDFAPFEPRLELAGLFTYFADSARLEACATGRSHVVAMEAGYLELERAYVDARPAPAAPVFVRIEGRIADRPRMEGEGSERAVVVERLIAIDPDGACAGPPAAPTLTDAHWRLVRLGERPVELPRSGIEPHLTLLAGDARFAAMVGCNRMMGGWEQFGAELRFSAVASTMMACPPPLDMLEHDFSAALAVTSGFRLLGDALELTDPEGRQLALFQAVYLR